MLFRSGFLDRCGGHTCPPHFPTNDPKTPNPYESHALRNALHDLIDITTPQFHQKGSKRAFDRFFSKWIDEQKNIAANLGRSFLVLKHPLKIFAIHIMEKYIDAQFLVLNRSMENIEQTRLRRKWPEIYGQQGAQVIYAKINEYLNSNRKDSLTITYDDFRQDKKQQDRIIDYFNLSPSASQLSNARNWLL